jgi:membrane protease YdiL (CAAX protease family)
LLRSLAFLLLAGLLVSGLTFLGFWLIRQLAVLGVDVVPDWMLAIGVGEEGVGAFAATALMARIGRRRFRDFGWGKRDRRRNFLFGLATGGLTLCLLMLALGSLSAVSLAPGPGGGAAIFYGPFYAVLMLGVGFAEESFFRGYALVALAQSLSFWPAALLTATLFSLLHSFNGGETPAGLVSVGLFGMVLAYSYRRTGSLWFACGLHGGWDFAQTFVFGVPNSGVVFPGGLLQPQFYGPVWLTGGSAGPEGSLLTVPALAIAVFVLEAVVRRRPGAKARGDAPTTATVRQG